MVQGELLRAHPGGNHDDGEASKVQSSLWYGTGIAYLGDPEIGIASAPEQLTK